MRSKPSDHPPARLKPTWNIGKDIKQLGPGTNIRAYENKDVIYRQGDRVNYIFYILSGIVKLSIRAGHARKKAVLAVLKEGDFFGEGALAGEVRRVSTALSVGPSTVVRIPSMVLRAKIHGDPSFASTFIFYLLLQTARLKMDLADHFFNSSERRLARVLMEWGGVQKSTGEPYIFPFNQTALAEIVGTTRTRISTFMSRFRERGYIQYNGDLEIDFERLAAFLRN